MHSKFLLSKHSGPGRIIDTGSARMLTEDPAFL